MQSLIYFLVKARPWILLVIYIVASLALLFRNNPYQHSVWLTSANAVSSSLYETANGVTSYFKLREINEDLNRRNAMLELEVLSLKNRLRHYSDMEFAINEPVDSSLSRYTFYLAHVINNSINRPDNYLTIDRGELDGIKPEMGVVDRNGIVGIVNVVGPHSARIISFLNSNLRISCKVKGYEQVGSLVWDGKKPDEAILEELPRHAVFNPGDTIVTSGYSTVFPEGVPVGVVLKNLEDYDENFFALRVRLFTDFSTLSTVRIIADNMKEELRRTEKDLQQK